MEQKVKELEVDIKQIKDEQSRTANILFKIEETLSKVAENQEKMIHFEHNLDTVKKDIKYLTGIYEAKLKGIQNLQQKEDEKLESDFIEIKNDIKDLRDTLKNVVFAILGTLGTAVLSLVLSQFGIKI